MKVNNFVEQILCARERDTEKVYLWVCVCACVSWRHGISLCPGSDCQRECHWCLIWTKTRLYSGYTGVCIYVCVFVRPSISLSLSLIPPHIQTLDVDSPLFVQCIHCGSYYANWIAACRPHLIFFLFFSHSYSPPRVSSLPLLFLFSFLPSPPLFSMQLCSACAPLISSFPFGL